MAVIDIDNINHFKVVDKIKQTCIYGRQSIMELLCEIHGACCRSLQLPLDGNSLTADWSLLPALLEYPHKLLQIKSLEGQIITFTDWIFFWLCIEVIDIAF